VTQCAFQLASLRISRHYFVWLFDGLFDAIALLAIGHIACRLANHHLTAGELKQ
jgi:hypothetical protein